MGLGKEEKGVAKFPNFKTQLTKEGLGFFEGCNRIKKNLGTINGNFVKEGRNFPFYGFPKLWWGKDGKTYPSWEIFFKEKPTMVIKEVQEELNWVDYMDAKDGGGRVHYHHQGAKWSFYFYHACYKAT